MKQIKNIIFDLDGTLIDSSEGVVEAVNYSLREMSEKEREPDEIKKYIGFPLSTMYPNFTDKPITELYRHFQIKAKETVVNSTVILPGVEDMLGGFYSRGIKMAIASTKIKEHIAGIVAKFDWHKYISAYSGGNEVERVKPAPDIFYLTLDKMNCKAEDTIVVGDTVNDLLAAREVPMQIAMIESPYESNLNNHEVEPDYRFSKWSEFISKYF